MYSPKIPDRLIPVLYRVARARRQHMTTLVAEAIDAYLARPEQAAGVAVAGAGTTPAVPIGAAVRPLRAMHAHRQPPSARDAA